MTDTSDDVRLSDFLSDISVAVVVALRTQDEGRIEELSSRLAELEGEFAADHPELAAFFGVLRGLLLGEEVTAAAENLVGPYRAGYERILQELETEPAAGEMSQSEWLARVTSLVATTVKHGSEQDRVELDRELTRIAGHVPREETEFHDFMAALQNVLRGEDPRKSAPKVQPPYREAYQSLLQLLAADDTTDYAVQAILEKIQHNTLVALTQGDRELRVSVAEALADIEDMLPEDDPTSSHFRALIAGAIALLIDREPPRAVGELPDPFAETWQKIQSAS